MMKKMIIAMMALLSMSSVASAMSYEQARNEALFLTDKMAYELNLTDAQYEAAYEINLDYLMGVTSPNDVYGPYWERRNLDLSYILYSWQWDLFRAATYFYRPLYWNAGYWHFGIYARYPHRDYFYFGRPHFYATYRGGHSWHSNGGRSFYEGRHQHFRPAISSGRSHFGMRDGFNRGDFRGSRGRSSTRVTAGRGGNMRPGNSRGEMERRGSMNNRGEMERRGSMNNRGDYGNSNVRRSTSGNFSGSRSSGNFNEGRRAGTIDGSRPSGNFNESRRAGTIDGSRSSNPSGNRSTLGNVNGDRPSSSNFSGNRSSRSMESSRSSSGSFSGSRSSSSMGSSRSSSGSFSGSRSSSSMGSSRSSSGSFGGSRSSGGVTRSGGSMGGGSHGGSSHGGGHGGISAGGRR